MWFLVFTWLGGFLIGFILLGNSCAAELEIGTGLTRFNPHGDGVWYQKAFPYRLELTSPSLSIGLKVKQSDALHYRFGYQYLGHYSSSAQATGSDADYEQFKTSHQLQFPLSHWYGKGYVHGLYATAQYGVRWFVEGGLYAYKPTWTMTIPDIRWCATCEPQYHQVKHKATWVLTPIIGFGYRFSKQDSVALNVRRPNTSGDEWTSIANRFAWNLEWRRSF